jgi:hypothetical protein
MAGYYALCRLVNLYVRQEARHRIQGIARTSSRIARPAYIAFEGRKVCIEMVTGVKQ